MMSSTSSPGTGRGRGTFPFTATQRQELENQALIYKYMTAGIPIPSDLLFTIKTNLHDPSLSSKLLFSSYPPSPLGWNPYQMGYGKKIDPEPGRCRRTDGKKWRCSKEAFPDSKYCERHMHRGKNRSRKPVENINNSSVVQNNQSLHSSSPYNNNNKNPNPNSVLYGFSSDPSSSYSSSLYPHHSTSSYNNHKDFSRERCFQGMKEEIGEYRFFKESRGTNMRGFSASSIHQEWPLNNSLEDDSKQSNNGDEKQCYIWGRDFNCELSMKKVDQEERENGEKTTPHHFFDEWAPLKDGGDGGGAERKRYPTWQDSSPSSTTQLSISIPTSAAASHHDFFLSNSGSHHHEG